MIKILVGFILRKLPRTLLQRISKPFFYIISIFYRGNKVSCPICGSQFSTFFPYGRETRENALCTNCLSLERHRFLYLYMRDVKRIFNKKMNILHIAPEACLTKKFKNNPNFQYVTADLYSPLADVKMDIHNIPFGDNHFDLVLCNHVLEHVEDDILALKEIRRVLKKNGFGIVMIPFYNPVPEITLQDKSIVSSKDREKYYGQSDHLRKYGNDFKNRFESSGLHIDVIKPEKFLKSSEIIKNGIIKSDMIISVSK